MSSLSSVRSSEAMDAFALPGGPARRSPQPSSAVTAVPTHTEKQEPRHDAGEGGKKECCQEPNSIIGFALTIFATFMLLWFYSSSGCQSCGCPEGQVFVPTAQTCYPFISFITSPPQICRDPNTEFFNFTPCNVDIPDGSQYVVYNGVAYIQLRTKSLKNEQQEQFCFSYQETQTLGCVPPY